METLEKSEEPVSATTFAKELGVTRQVIVGDVALLRASGVGIIATPRGYLLEVISMPLYVVACEHSSEMMEEELFAIVDSGCGLVDVMVEHPLYGEITCNLHIFTRKEATEFLEKFRETNSKPLSDMTNHIHLHRLQCPSEEHFLEVQKVLREKGFLRENQ